MKQVVGLSFKSFLFKLKDFTLPEFVIINCIANVNILQVF